MAITVKSSQNKTRQCLAVVINCYKAKGKGAIVITDLYSPSILFYSIFKTDSSEIQRLTFLSAINSLMLRLKCNLGRSKGLLNI